MRDGHLVDTNHLAQAVRPTSPVYQRIVAERLRGIRVGTCVPVICEVQAGARQVSEPEKYRRQPGRLLRHVRVWPLDLETAEHYGDIHIDLRRRGRVLSQVDMMLAALARQMSLTVLTTDKDIAALPDARTENWLGP